MPYWIVSQVAARVAQELRCSLGGAVGYSIRFEDVTTKVTRWKKRL
jgi:HrpA-like RNA helicase